MEKRCDLHTHSFYSDGTLPPGEIIDLAVKEGLSAVALTDHNTVRGDKEFLEAARKCGVIGVAGIEISTQWKKKEIHLLGLFLPETSFEKIEKRMEQELSKKRRQYMKLSEKLSQAGMNVSFEELEKENPGSLINRAHFATALMNGGYAATVKEAFQKFLSPEKGFYIPPEKPDTADMVKFVLECGGVPVVAHPMISLKKDDIPAFADDMTKAGVAGMETRYSEYSCSQRDYITYIVRSHELLESGGSDFHGSRKPMIFLGRGMGRLNVPFSIYEDLRDWRNKK